MNTDDKATKKATKIADLGAFTSEIEDKTEDGAVLELKHPATGAPIGVHIRVKGADSEASLEMQRRTSNRRLRQGINAKITSEELIDDSCAQLSALTISWRSEDGPVIVWKGVKLECNRDNAKRIYSEAPWIRKQVDSFASDLGNFLGNSETPSSITPVGSGG